MSVSVFNCAVKVTRDEIFSIDYKKLTGHVWEKQKINRDFSKSSVVDCEFRVFIKNISGDNTERLKSMESTLGYLMHSHKPASYSPAVILNDEVISDNPEGGTGKGIFVKSISHMKKMVIIDGKGFSFQKSFPYQRVQVDTQTLVFDDVAIQRFLKESAKLDSQIAVQTGTIDTLAEKLLNAGLALEVVQNSQLNIAENRDEIIDARAQTQDAQRAVAA